jgi:serine/threonine-protein kinase
MSPEQAAGRSGVDARSDIYSLGALACFLLTGEPPFVCPTVAQTLVAHMNEPIEPLRARVPSVPEDLEAVVLTCLRKQPDERFADVASLDRALAACGSTSAWTQSDARSAPLAASDVPVGLAVPDAASHG